VQVGFRFCFARHVAAHVPFEACVFKGKPFLSTVTRPLLFRRHHYIFFFAPLSAPALHSRERFLFYVIQTPLATHSNGKALQQEAGRGLDHIQDVQNRSEEGKKGHISHAIRGGHLPRR
jgi:hypothetical protein